MIYPLMFIAVLVYAVWRGWNKGMIHQVASLLGLSFGFVAARLFVDHIAGLIDPHFPSPDHFGAEPFGGMMRGYTLSLASAALVFTAVYWVFRLLGLVLESAMQLIHTGAVNSIIGAAFCACKWTVILSVVFNLWLAFKPDCGLLKYCDAGDGNVVELVMQVAPALFGTESPDDLEHYRRLEQGKQLGLD